MIKIANERQGLPKIKVKFGSLIIQKIEIILTPL